MWCRAFSWSFLIEMDWYSILLLLRLLILFTVLIRICD